MNWFAGVRFILFYILNSLCLNQMLLSLIALQCLCLLLIMCRSWFTTAHLQKYTGSPYLPLQLEENYRDTRYCLILMKDV